MIPGTNLAEYLTPATSNKLYSGQTIEKPGPYLRRSKSEIKERDNMAVPKVKVRK